MNRAILPTVLAAATLGFCAQAMASATATAPAEARIIERVGIDVVSPLVIPNVTATSIGSVSGVNSSPTSGASASGAGASAAGSGSGSGSGGNATLTIHGQVGGAVSMSVPQSFTVVRTGGTESLTVQTSTNSNFGLGGDGVLLGGTAMNGNTMSVNVGGELALASTDRLVPGPYEGLLVVVVQYN